MRLEFLTNEFDERLFKELQKPCKLESTVPLPTSENKGVYIVMNNALNVP